MAKGPWLSEPGDEWSSSQSPTVEGELLDLLLPPDTTIVDQLAIEDLAAAGFSVAEAIRLLDLRQCRDAIPEMAERLMVDPRWQFVKWMCQQGHFSEQ